MWYTARTGMRLVLRTTGLAGGGVDSSRSAIASATMPSGIPFLKSAHVLHAGRRTGEASCGGLGEVSARAGRDGERC